MKNLWYISVKQKYLFKIIWITNGVICIAELSSEINFYFSLFRDSTKLYLKSYWFRCTIKILFFSLIQFFNKMKKWSDMANLRKDFREKIDRLERNFAVSTVIFKKFEPIFLDIFRNPLDEPAKQNRSRKQRYKYLLFHINTCILL